MNDYVALRLMVLLLGANAFFVGAEFSLISARRDRLEAMIGDERRSTGSSAAVVLRATEHLSMMLAAAQLGITICSLALGSLGEPTVAHPLEAVLEPIGVPDVLILPIAFVVALAVVTVLHIVIGEMVPKNIAIAGPEPTALRLVPPLVAFLTVARPVISVLNWLANHILRLLGVTPRDEAGSAYTPQEIAEMLSESRREGLLDASQTQRLTQALTSAEHTVADVLVSLERVTALPPSPTLGAVEGAVARTGFSRFPVRAPESPDARAVRSSGSEPSHGGSAGRRPPVELVGYVHIKDVLDLDPSDPDQIIPAERIRTLPQLAISVQVDEALALLRREGSHLARAVDADGTTVGVVAMEDLVEEYVGTVRDSTHVTRPGGSGRRS